MGIESIEEREVLGGTGVGECWQRREWTEYREGEDEMEVDEDDEDIANQSSSSESVRMTHRTATLRGIVERTQDVVLGNASSTHQHHFVLSYSLIFKEELPSSNRKKKR